VTLSAAAAPEATLRFLLYAIPIGNGASAALSLVPVSIFKAKAYDSHVAMGRAVIKILFSAQGKAGDGARSSTSHLGAELALFRRCCRSARASAEGAARHIAPLHTVAPRAQTLPRLPRFGTKWKGSHNSRPRSRELQAMGLEAVALHSTRQSSPKAMPARHGGSDLTQ